MCHQPVQKESNNELLEMNLSELLSRYAFMAKFFENNKIESKDIADVSFSVYLRQLSPLEIRLAALNKEQMKLNFLSFFEQHWQSTFGHQMDVESLTILPGFDKDGVEEPFKQLRIEKGEIISVVGPTGSGKSRLLADIEWMANKDTPSRRKILINDELPDYNTRFSTSNRLVAQLSQNMNFIMDLTVDEFLELHAESRFGKVMEKLVAQTIRAANELSGEPFDSSKPLVELSGGQTRALMIADIALLSDSLIVLIDEIENAGIDRHKAIRLLTGAHKIVLIATHDPGLALLADQRITIRNGGIQSVKRTSDHERALLREIDRMNHFIDDLRVKLRQGESL